MDEIQITDRKYVYIHSKDIPFLKRWKKKFYYSKETLANKYFCLLFPKDFHYKEIFNRKITLMHAMGFPYKNYDIYFGPTMLVARDRSKNLKDKPKQSRFKTTVEALTLLFIGNVFAFLIFSTEFAWGHNKKAWDKKWGTTEETKGNFIVILRKHSRYMRGKKRQLKKQKTNSSYSK